ncbi:hypothetical protein UFOVP816_15 [uncultured Caudovirales phage]|uniref:Uncharacterized protein n=1 Tax=uncultured Caudovirales phage TaxID=2100421 RepID=A0A6J5NXC2_9CAUD|nr:hypothetical protein UFOVP816_15 [uncultured Caudovirales phage]
MIPQISPQVSDNKVEVKESCNCCTPSSCFGRRVKHKHQHKKKEELEKVERLPDVNRRFNKAP